MMMLEERTIYFITYMYVSYSEFLLTLTLDDDDDVLWSIFHYTKNNTRERKSNVRLE